jgi:hypothetical protein
MAFHNANYQAVNLTGTMDSSQLGNGVTASTVHQVFCLTDGSIEITALGGGKFTWAATAGQSIDVLVKEITVSSGTFVGFKSKFFPRQQTFQGNNY